MESVISLQDLASDAHSPHNPMPATNHFDLTSDTHSTREASYLPVELELQSSSSWVFPVTLPSQRRAAPEPLTSMPTTTSSPPTTRAALRVPMDSVTTPQHAVLHHQPLSTFPPDAHRIPSISLLDMFKEDIPPAKAVDPSGPVETARSVTPAPNDTPAMCLALQSKIQELESREMEHQSKCSTLEMKLKAMTVRLHDMSSNHAAELRSVEDDQFRLKAQLHTTLAQVATLEQTQYTLRNQVQEAQNALTEQLQVKEAQVRALRDEDIDQKKIISILEVYNQVDVDALTAKSHELRTLHEQFHDLSVAHDTLKDKLRQNALEMERMRKDYAKVQFELGRRSTNSSPLEVRPPVPPSPPPALLPTALSPEKTSRSTGLPVDMQLAGRERPKSLADLGFGQLTSRKADELNSSTNVRNLLSYDRPSVTSTSADLFPNRVQFNAPFATEKQSFQDDVVARRELEGQLLHWHIQRETLHAEYSKLDQMGFRTMHSRRRKAEIESSLHTVDKTINQLKLRLR
ncbi:hypothetical protein DYB25_010495 [Aphanomyces astaci]|uniref:Enkurin domain-containing protein n=2 Tax=Aphanomyces astaci TaxID=112090 RepID=A0A396ZTN9_APHAT|nr:hypothetical protein DYB25_010495 [Aphanomyces astaci]